MPLLTWDAIRSAHPGMGRNDMPEIVADAYSQGRFVDLDQLALAITDAWTMAEFPGLILELSDWEEMFDAVGFIDNGVRASRPKKIPTLWRATVEEHEIGMSWTDNIERARWFYDRNTTWGFTSKMLRLDDARWILAHFHGEGTRNESEWVLDSIAAADATEVDR